jgi:hypothetical protein
MTIVEAVKRAIEEGADELWSAFVKGGTAHHYHVTYAQSVDARDADIMRRLARGQPSARAGMTFIDRKDGSLRPWPILPPDVTYDGPERRQSDRRNADRRQGERRKIGAGE